MHAVGDRADRHLGGVEARPQAGEHLPADLAVQHGDAVDPLREPHAHHRHVEHVRVAARVGLRAEREHPVDRQPAARRRPAAKYRSISSRGNRSMPAGTGVCVVKTVPARDSSSASSKRQPGRQVLPDPLEAEEAGVPLVGVEHLGLRVAGDRAEGAHRAHAADAEQQLLAEPVLGAAAVEPVGHLVQRGLVLLHVGVEHQQRHPAHLGQPDLRGQQLALGEGHGHLAPGRPPADASRVSGRPLGSSAGYRSACQPSADSDWVKYPCR